VRGAGLARAATYAFEVESADWFVLGIVALGAIYGFMRGLVRGALSLAGFALGAYIGARVAPAILEDGSPYAPLLALGGALLGGTLLSASCPDCVRSTPRPVPCSAPEPLSS
jgi:hypothetical protein